MSDPYNQSQNPSPIPGSPNTPYGAQPAPGSSQSPYDSQPTRGASQPAPDSTQSPYGAPPASGSPQSPYGGPAAPTGSSSGGRREAGFFKAMFDFSFEHFITVKFSSFIYVLAFIVAGLYWILQIVSGVVFGLALGADVWTGEQGFNPLPLIAAILLGWIPSVIMLIAMRLGLEFAVATVRTSQNTRRIAEVAEARA